MVTHLSLQEDRRISQAAQLKVNAQYLAAAATHLEELMWKSFEMDSPVPSRSSSTDMFPGSKSPTGMELTGKVDRHICIPPL